MTRTITSYYAGDYVSIFEDPGRFDQQIRIAEALSRTQFVPPSFRGKPEDCLVALDLACRFQLAPLAIFPEIYVIDNKASFSSKFLIALVNRSGRFSRIQWTEGINGEINATCTDWKKNGIKGERDEWSQTFKNYYAQASFVEKATGEEFKSPVVDMQFADANGWISKPGSKWRTMPEIMCRYRSAAILIKSVCPEIVAGLEFAEDVADARDDTIDLRRSATIGSSVRTVEQIEQGPTVHEFSERIAAAATLGELLLIGDEVKTAGFSSFERDVLANGYKRRRDELCGNQQAGTIETPPSIAAPEPDAFEAVQDVMQESAFEELNLQPKETKAASLESSGAKRQKPTEAQARNYDGLIDSLKKSKDTKGIKNLSRIAEGYLSNGMLTQKQLISFLSECDKFAEKILI